MTLAAALPINHVPMLSQEPYLFGMALRAVGNLTRCDENIMRVVGYGVIKGIVQV